VSRGFPTAVSTALAQQHVSIVSFAKLEFPSGTVYVHNSIGTYNWGSQNWLGVGSLGSISKVEEGMDVSPYAITLTLSGLDADMSSAALTEDYFMHPVTIYLGVLNADDVLIADPTQIWAGFMDQMNVSVGADGGDAIQLIAESELSRFNVSRNLMYTNAAQQQRHSGDLFFSHIQDVQGAKFDWGAKTPGQSGAGGGNPGSRDGEHEKRN
tara:strand:+ start:2070 stop:2702 length:633 start_codon:yes stop_codon:yes gene_type:complete